MSDLYPLRRGTVLRKTTPGSVEVGVVLGPPNGDLPVKCAHGWIDNPPDVGLFWLTDEHFRRGIWRIATEEDAAAVRALFLAHAKQWGPGSEAWVVADGPSAWETSPVAMRWDDREEKQEAGDG